MIRERSSSPPLAPLLEQQLQSQAMLDLQGSLSQHKNEKEYIQDLKKFAVDLIHECLRRMKQALDGGYLKGIRDAALTLKIECGKVGANQLWQICDELHRAHDIGNYVWMERLYQRLLIAVIQVKYLIPVVLLFLSSTEKQKQTKKLPELTQDEQRRIDLCVVSQMNELLPDGYEIVKENEGLIVKKKPRVRQAKFSSHDPSCCEGCPIF